MFAVVQFPLADARPYLPSDTNRLSIPSWPNPVPEEDFVRGFGVVSKRPRGGLRGLVGEEVFSNAKRGVRFAERRLGGGVLVRDPKVVFRRFLATDTALARFEVAFVRRDFATSRAPVSDGELITFVDGLLGIKVRTPSMQLPTDLQLAGRPLANFYLRATTKIDNGEPKPTQGWWVSPGAPMVLVEYEDDGVLSLPPHTRYVADLEDPWISLSHFRLRRRGKAVGVWLLGVCDHTDERYLRELRIHLCRLHAEKECLKHILRHVAQGKITVHAGTDAFEGLQDYLTSSIRVVTKDTRYGLPQSEILKTAFEGEDIVAPGEQTTLLTQLEKARRHLQRQVDQYTRAASTGFTNTYVIHGGRVTVAPEQNLGGKTVTKYTITIGDHANFSGDFVVAQTIQDSFKRVEESSVAEELKARLEDLHRAVAGMAEKLPEDTSRDAARDLETLTREVTSESPRRKWYELSAEGLIQAAKTAGEIATPVVTAVRAVLALLA